MTTCPPRHSSRLSSGSAVVRSLFALVFSGAMLTVDSAHAASGNWNGATSGVWQLNGNWSGVAFPATGDTATFNGAGNGNTTLDIGTGLIVKAIVFDTSGAAAYTIGSGAVNTQTLNLNDLGAITVNSSVANNELFNSTITLGTATASTYTFTNNGANTLTFAGNVQGGTGGTAAAKTLTVAGSGSTTMSGVIANGGASSLALTMVGPGVLTLTNANTYTGNTTINGGTLKLDFTAGGAPSSNIISSSSALKLGGGTLNIVGASGGSTQTFASTSFTGATGGQTVISAAAASGTAPTINLGTMTGTQGALVRFDGAAYNSGASSGTTLGGTTVAATANYTTTTATMTGGLISVNNGSLSNANNSAMSYATVGLYDWAAISGATTGSAASTGTIVGASQNSGFYTTTNSLSSTGTFGLNIDLTASSTMFGNANVSGSYSTIRFNAAGATTLTVARALGGSVLGGLLVTPNVGANNVTIAPNTGQGQTVFQASRSTNAATGVTVWQNNTAGELIINAVYANGSNSAATGTYTQGGMGTVVLGGVNTYSGQIYLDGGTTVISANSGVGAVATGATVNLNGGTLFGNATFSLDNAGANNRGINVSGVGGTLAASAGNTMTVSGVVSGASNAPLIIGTGTIAGTGAGTANTTAVVGNGTVALTAANSYSGGTTVNAGTLQINGINALGGANYGGLTLNGGKIQYAASFSGNGSGDLTSIGTAGVTLAAGGGTIDTNGNNVTYAGSIGNGGSGALTKTGTGTLTLSAAGTYTGGTTINGGTLAAGDASSLGTGALTIGSGATFSVGAFNLGIGAITLSGSSNLLLSGITSSITSSGAISISGSGNLLTLGGTAAAAGNTYTLLLGTGLSASGISLTGSGVGGATVALGSNATVGRTTYSFSSTATALQLAVTGGAFNLTWNGGSANWNTTDANWQQNGTGGNIAFFTGDNITIATGDSIAVDAGGITAGTVAATNVSGTAVLTGGTLTATSLSKSGAGTLQLNNVINGATLAVSGGTLDLGTQSQSFANVSLTGGSITGTTGVLTATGNAIDAEAGNVGAILAGTVGLTKTTAGTVVLTGTNTYTGATTISAGTLQIGDGGTAGSISGTSGVTNNATLDYNRGDALSVGYAISGAGALVKDGTGTLTLTNANTYTGETTINTGTLQIGNGGTTGSIATTSDVVNNGTLDYNRSDNLTTGYATSGTGVVVKDGAGTLTLGVASTYQGGTMLNAGTLALASGTAAGSGMITAANGTTLAATSGVGGNTVGNGITITGTNANVTLTNNNLSGGFSGGITGSADQTLTLSSAGGTSVNMNATTQEFANFLGTVVVLNGAGLGFRATSLNNGGNNTTFQVDGSMSTRNNGNIALGALTGTGTLSMGTSGSSNQAVTYTIGAKNIDSTFSGVIQDGDATTGKVVKVTKTGTGALTLSGTNTYTGATTVSAGTLLVSGSLANTAVTVGASGLLGGSGSIAGATVINGTLAPGSGPNLLTFGSSLTLNPGSSTLMQVGGNTTAGSDYTKVVTTGAITFGGSLVVSSYDLGGGTYNIAQAATLHLFASGSESGNFSDVTVVGTSLTYDSGSSSWLATGVNGFDYNFALATGDLVISATSAIPEPSIFALFASLAGLGFVIHRRRRA